MAAQCQHLKSCKAMANFRKENGEYSADVNWKYCQTCPLHTQQPASPKRTQGFREKTITKG